MSNLHKYNISHNRLKLKHILIDEEEEDILKLSNFSQSEYLLKENDYKSTKKIEI